MTAMASRLLLSLLIAASLAGAFPPAAVSAAGRADEAKPSQKKQQEIAAREEQLKKEEERLKAMRKDVEDLIEKYTKLLASVDEKVTSLETARNARLDHVVKTYEAMQPEEAAARLGALDDASATKILFRMKAKKAGAVMAAMEPQKAANLSEEILKTAKKIPTR